MQLSRLVDDSVLLRLDHFVVILVLVVATLRCRGRGNGSCVLVLIIISSSGSIVVGHILRGGVRTFFGLLTNRVVNF